MVFLGVSVTMQKLTTFDDWRVTKNKTRGIMILQKNRNFMTRDDGWAKKLHQSGGFFHSPILDMALQFYKPKYWMYGIFTAFYHKIQTNLA